MVEYPSSRGCGCPSVLPRPPKLSLQCFLLQPRDWDVAKGLTGLRHCTGGLVMITDYSKPCGIWSMCKLQLGDSHPFCSAEPKASWIVQRTAEFKAFSYLWIWERMVSCWKLQTSMGEISLGLVAGGDLALETHPQALERALLSFQITVLP